MSSCACHFSSLFSLHRLTSQCFQAMDINTHTQESTRTRVSRLFSAYIVRPQLRTDDSYKVCGIIRTHRQTSRLRSRNLFTWYVLSKAWCIVHNRSPVANQRSRSNPNFGDGGISRLSMPPAAPDGDVTMRNAGGTPLQDRVSTGA